MSTENKQWYNLNSGVNGSVNSICAFNDELYVAGNFTKAGSVDVASGFAKWNGNTWLSVANIVGTINSCVVYNDELYVAGNFTSINSVPCTNIAKFNGTSWSAIGSTPKEIYKLKVIGSDLFALSYYNTNETINSGIFILNSETWNAFDLSIPLGKNEPYNSTENFIRINDIEKYGVNYFSAISNIFALAVYSNKLIAGGRFDIQGISVLKQYDNNSWTTFGGGIPLELNGSSNPSIVYSLNVYNNELYVAGLFNRIESLDKNLGLSVNSIAKWNGQIWSNFNYNESVSNIKTIFNYESELNIKSGTYIGGSFSYISDAIAKNIAVFSDIVEIPKTIYDLVGNLDQQCANIIPCGFRISQPDRPSDACGPRDGIDGAQGPPGLPGADGKDGTGCGKTYFIATDKNRRHGYQWNNPIDTNQWLDLSSPSVLEPIWDDCDLEPTPDTGQNNAIPVPGGGADQFEFFNNLPKNPDGSIDLSQIDSECDLIIDIGHYPDISIYFPNPDWDGVSTGPLVGENETYYDDNGQSYYTGNQGPFLLPAFVIPSGAGVTNCNEVLECTRCYVGSRYIEATYSAYGGNGLTYSVSNIESGCIIVHALDFPDDPYISNVQILNQNTIVFDLAENPAYLERLVGPITIRLADNLAPSRDVNVELWIRQKAKIKAGQKLARIVSRNLSTPLVENNIPKWEYTCVEVIYNSNEKTWDSIGDQFIATNFLEYNGVVNTNSGYGGVELLPGSNDGFPLVGFENFKYKPVPVNLIVLVFETYDDEGEPESYWFSAPNPIIGQCQVDIT